MGAETIGVKVVKGAVLLQAQGVYLAPGRLDFTQRLVTNEERGLIVNSLPDEVEGFGRHGVLGGEEGVAAANGFPQ